MRSVLDAGLGGKAAVSSRGVQFGADIKAEAVAFQAIGTAESTKFEVPLLGGTTGLVKATGMLNAVAIGGTGEAYFKVSNGVAKVGAGFSASAFFGGGIKLNGELDFNKFSPYKLFDY